MASYTFDLGMLRQTVDQYRQARTEGHTDATAHDVARRIVAARLTAHQGSDSTRAAGAAFQQSITAAVDECVEAQHPTTTSCDLTDDVIGQAMRVFHLVEKMRMIARACKSARDRISERALHSPASSTWYADLVPAACFDDDVPWYAREVDAQFQAVPIPISASPHWTNAPPSTAIVLHSADVAIGWAA